MEQARRRLPRRRVDRSVVNALIVLGCGIAIAAAWAYAVWMPAGAGPASGPIRSSRDIPPEVQAVLQQAPAPAHDAPTEWGLLLINPVIEGEALINVEELPLPSLRGLDAADGKAEGESAFDQLAEQGLHVIRIPELHRKGMEVRFVRSITQGRRFYTYAYLESGVGTEDYLSLEVEAYTPTAPVPVEEFPDNAIRDFRKWDGVRGHPTITVFPDPGTSDPRNERLVAWSQDGAVYFLRTTGRYLDEDLLALARYISEAEEKR